MNDSPEIGEETKRRIRQIAEEIGYVPDSAGQRLRTGRTNVIYLAFVIHRDDQMGQLIASIASALRPSRYQVCIAPVLSHDETFTTIRQVVEQRMADAVIFNETLVNDPRVEYLLERGFPFATHGRDALSHMHPHFDFDNGAFARKAAQLLHRRGRKWLALLGPPHEHNYGRETFDQASSSAAELGLRFVEIDGAHSNEPLAVLQSVARRFVIENPDCDGFVCSSGAATLAIAAGVEEAGRQIGRDIDVITKGSRMFINMIRPSILVIEEDAGRAAEVLSEAVLQAIRSPELAPMQEVEEPDFAAYL